MRRGEIYLAELRPRSGAEIQGERPVLVVSHDSFNRVTSWRSVTVVPLTTSANQARRGPTAVPIPDGAGGLRGDGIAVCHQLTTLDRAKLTRRLGQLPPDVLAAVEDGMRAALDLA
jgi:mRNA interferase MazF